MEKAWEWAKQHPYATGAIVFVALILIYILFFRRSAAPTGPSDYQAQQAAAAAEAASGNQLAAVQAQLQAQTNQANAQVSAQANTDATNLQIAQLAAQTSMNHDTLAAAVAENTNAATLGAAQYTAQAQETASTVGAQVAQFNTGASTLQNLYDTLAADLTGGGSGTLDGLTLAGDFTINGTPSSFNITGSRTNGPVTFSPPPAQPAAPGLGNVATLIQENFDTRTNYVEYGTPGTMGEIYSIPQSFGPFNPNSPSTPGVQDIGPGVDLIPNIGTAIPMGGPGYVPIIGTPSGNAAGSLAA